MFAISWCLCANTFLLFSSNLVPLLYLAKCMAKIGFTALPFVQFYIYIYMYKMQIAPFKFDLNSF